MDIRDIEYHCLMEEYYFRRWRYYVALSCVWCDTLEKEALNCHAQYIHHFNKVNTYQH